MKNKLFLSAILAVTFTLTAQAQSIFDKIDNLAGKVDRAANTADRAGKSGGKVISLFNKKDQTSKSAIPANNVNTTVISIAGISMENLKKLNSIIQSTKGVSSSVMKFSSSNSTLTVSHAGSTDQLLSAIQPKSSDIFTDKHITEMEDGAITLKLK